MGALWYRLIWKDGLKDGVRSFADAIREETRGELEEIRESKNSAEAFWKSLNWDWVFQVKNLWLWGKNVIAAEERLGKLYVEQILACEFFGDNQGEVYSCDGER